MAGVFVSKGMGFRIPAGALTISIGVDGAREVSLSRVEVSLDFWDHWLEVARERAIQAVNLHRKLLHAHADGDDDARSEVFGSLLRAAMTCMGALGFTLDALYSSVKERLPPDVVGRIGTPTTRRYKRVHETLRQASRLTNEDASFARSVVKQVFEFRDGAVHPPGGWSEPIVHPDFGVGMAAGYVRFGAMNAAKGYFATRSVVNTALLNVRPEYADLAEWARGAVQRLPEALPADIVVAPGTDGQT